MTVAEATVVVDVPEPAVGADGVLTGTELEFVGGAEATVGVELDPLDPVDGAEVSVVGEEGSLTGVATTVVVDVPEPVMGAGVVLTGTGVETVGRTEATVELDPLDPVDGDEVPVVGEEGSLTGVATTVVVDVPEPATGALVLVGALEPPLETLPTPAPDPVLVEADPLFVGEA